MSEHTDSNWYREYLAKRGEKDGDAKVTRMKKEWDEALTELSPEEKRQREEEADDRDFVYLESPKEVFSVVRQAWKLASKIKTRCCAAALNAHRANAPPGC